MGVARIGARRRAKATRLVKSCMMVEHEVNLWVSLGEWMSDEYCFLDTLNKLLEKEYGLRGRLYMKKARVAHMHWVGCP
jgi:hypothetical protein